MPRLSLKARLQVTHFFAQSLRRSHRRVLLQDSTRALPVTLTGACLERRDLLLQRVHTRCQRALDLYLGRQLCRKLLLAVLQLRLELCRGGEVGKQLPTRTPNPLNRFSALARGMHAYVHACMHAFMHVYAQETTRTIRRR